MANHLVQKWLPVECFLICACFYLLFVYMFRTGKQIIKNVAYNDMFIQFGIMFRLVVKDTDRNNR